MRPTITNAATATTLGLAALTLAACGGGGSSSAGGGGASAPPSTLTETLDRLGVDTTSTARVDPMGNALPADYGPLGTTFELTRRTELLISGIPWGGGFTSMIQEDVTGTPTLWGAPTLWSENSPSWLIDSDPDPAVHEPSRVTEMGDFDGDGIDEMVDVRIDASGVVLRFTDELTAVAPTSTEVPLTGSVPARGLEAVAADVDGDLRDELVVALCDGAEVTVLVVQDSSEAFVVDTPLTLSFPVQLAGASSSAVLRAGNLDGDPGDEVVLVRNEVAGAIRTCRWALLDDAAHGLAVLRDEPVALDDGLPSGPAIALHADAAIGDFDGDNVDEILLVGPTEDPDPACGDFDYFGYAIDDGMHGFADLGGRRVTDLFDNCLQNEPLSMWWIPALALDLDGDRIDEVFVGRFAFELDPEGGVVWRPVPSASGGDLELDEDLFFDVGANAGSQEYHRSTSSLVAGDFDGLSTGSQPGGADEIACFYQGADEIRIYPFEVAANGNVGLGAPKPFFMLHPYPGPGAHYTELAPCNVDEDSITLVRTETEHELVYTEPVVLAVLAAPPCTVGIGQNLGACATTFGNTVSQSTEETRTLSASASATVGFSIDGGAITQSELEVTATMSTTLRRAEGETYDLSRSITFETGALEDAVVFTAVPMDRYTYRVLDHPDPSLEGRELVVDLPRQPVLTHTELEYYNQTVLEASDRIPTSVLTHTPGDHSSYKGLGEKNQLVALTGGLEQGPVQVGTGNSLASTLALSVGSAVSTSGALEMGYEFSVMATTGGAVFGYSIGSSVEDSITVVSGQETSYTGTVGSIPTGSAIGNVYSWGLFTYVYEEPGSGREFQVIDYWVQ